MDGTSLPPLGEHFAEIVLELAPDGIAVTDESGRILHANGRFEDLFGYTREQLVGHPVEMLLPSRVRGSTAITGPATSSTPPRGPWARGWSCGPVTPTARSCGSRWR